MRPEWFAYYKNGNKLRQYGEDGTESSFQDIDKGELERFALACPFNVVLELDAKTGHLIVNNKRINDEMLNSITCIDSANYGAELIQFKRARVLINGGSTSDEVLDSANVGFKIKADNKLFQFIVEYVVHDQTLHLHRKITDLELEEVVHEDVVGISGVS